MTAACPGGGRRAAGEGLTPAQRAALAPIIRRYEDRLRDAEEQHMDAIYEARETLAKEMDAAGLTLADYVAFAHEKQEGKAP